MAVSSSALTSSSPLARQEFHCRPWLPLFAGLFPGELRLMQEIGIHPYDSTAIPNPYNNFIAERDFRNIGEHSFAVAAAARTLAQLLVQVGKLPIREWRRVVQRALLHDAIKPFEIMHGQATGDHSEIEQARADLIQSLGTTALPSYLVQLLCTAGKEAGHSSLQSYVELDERGNLKLVPGALCEKLVHLCDALTQSTLPREGHTPVTHFVSPAERVFSISARYKFMRQGGLMATPEGKIEAVAELNLVLRPNRRLGDYAEIQQFVAEEICKELLILLAPGAGGSQTEVSTEEATEFVLHLLRLECVPSKAW